MGGFALPALHINPPQQQENPLSQISQILQLKNQMQNAPLQRQALQQQIESGSLENQQKQMQVNDQQAMTKAMQEWDGKDINGLVPLVIKNRGSAQAVMGLKSKALEMQQTYSKIAADDATTGQKNIETRMKKNDLIGGAFSTVLQAPDADLPNAITSTAQSLAQQGLLDPQHLQVAQQIASQPPAQARQALDTMRKGMLADSQLLEQAKQKAATASEQANAARVQYEMTQRQANGGMTPAEAQTGKYQQQEVGLRNRELGIQGGRLQLEKQKLMAGLTDNGGMLTGDAYLATLPPGLAAQVKASANGDIAIPPPSARSPQAQMIRNAVMTYDPTYTDARYKGKQNFKTSGDANSVMQLSTAMEHADRAIENSGKVGFSPALGNKTFESGTSGAYMQDAEFLTGEVGKLVKNGVLSVDEGNKISSGLTAARQSVRDASLHETMDLLGGKTRALFQKYKNSTAQDLPVNEFFDSKSQQRLQKYGLLEGQQAQAASGGLSVTAPNGKVYTFKDQASADAFKHKAGIQ